MGPPPKNSKMEFGDPPATASSSAVTRVSQDLQCSSPQQMTPSMPTDKQTLRNDSTNMNTSNYDNSIVHTNELESNDPSPTSLVTLIPHKFPDQNFVAFSFFTPEKPTFTIVGGETVNVSRAYGNNFDEDMDIDVE